MTRRRAVASVAVIMGVLGASGCGGGRAAPTDPLRPRATSAVIDGDVRFEHITFASASGRRLAAVLVRPRGFAPRGCLIWQNGVGPTQDDPAEIWHRAARLGLAVLTVDLPHDGVRAVTPSQLAAADPNRLAALVRGWLADLGRAADLLERRPECRRNVGYVGVGLGGLLGGALAARDPRIRATILASAWPTWRALLDAGGATVAAPLAPLDPERTIGAIPPRPVLVVAGDPFARPGDAGAVFKVERFLLERLVRPTYG